MKVYVVFNYEIDQTFPVFDIVQNTNIRLIGMGNTYFFFRYTITVFDIGCR